MAEREPIRRDQVVRVFCAGFASVTYVARLLTHGNGPVQAFGFEPNSFVVIVLALLVLAIPDLVNDFPAGPSRKG